MMNYELFKEVVKEKFQDYMPAEYADHRVDTQQVTKVNQTLDSINLIPKDNKGFSAVPSMYINTMYEHYKECEDLQEVLQTAADTMAHAFKKAPQIVPGLDLDTAKDNIIMVLVNTEQNKELLKNAPHREFQDLSVIYRWVVGKDAEGIQSSIVHYDIAETLGMSEEALYQAAVVNTKNLFPPTIKSMNDVMRDMLMADGMQGEMADIMIGEISDERTMWVISNDRGIGGAASMLYEEGLHNLAEKLETDLYIMPSSIHEVIAVSTHMGDPNDLARMVNEVNMAQVSLEERLSNQVYHYDKDLRKLSLATDTPNKRLDGIVAEPKLIYEAKDQSR